MSVSTEENKLLAVRVAEFYCDEDRTQDEIGALLQISRWKVGRLLAQLEPTGSCVSRSSILVPVDWASSGCSAIASISKGFWFAPTIFTGVEASHRIAREEAFGPVLGAHLPDARGGHREGQQHAVWSLRRELNRQRFSYFNISAPEPTGVVAVIALQDSALLLVSVVGNAVVVVANEAHPLLAVSLAEVSRDERPSGRGRQRAHRFASWLATHADVNVLDLAGGGDIDWVDLQIAAEETLTRVLSPGEVVARRSVSPRSPRSRRSGSRRA